MKHPTQGTCAEWRTADGLPSHTGSDWALLTGRKVKTASFEEVVRALRGWHPLQPVLVGAPNSPIFVPPPRVPELEDTIERFHKRTKQALAALLIGSLVLFAAWLASRGRNGAPVYIITLLLTFIGGFDYFVYLRHLPLLTERAQFYYWLQSSPKQRKGFVFWLSVAVLMGVAQLVVQRAAGGFEQAVIRYGLFYEPARNGEIWRFVTGPFFHSGIGHYINNALSLSFVGVVAWSLIGARSLLVFLCGTVLAAAFQMQFGSAQFDSYLGVSGGVFALYGFVVATGASVPGIFPRGFTTLCTLIAVTTVVGTELLSTLTASVAHITGALTGVICGLLWSGVLLRNVPHKQSH